MPSIKSSIGVLSSRLKFVIGSSQLIAAGRFSFRSRTLEFTSRLAGSVQFDRHIRAVVAAVRHKFGRNRDLRGSNPFAMFASFQSACERRRHLHKPVRVSEDAGLGVYFSKGLFAARKLSRPIGIRD